VERILSTEEYMWMREKISTRETVREEGTSSMGVHTRVSLISHTDRTLTWIMIQEITIGAIKKRKLLPKLPLLTHLN
jgi:hypothetical protein